MLLKTWLRVWVSMQMTDVKGGRKEETPDFGLIDLIRLVESEENLGNK